MPKPTTPSGTAQERLLEAAASLFYQHGITATGIDTITQTAGVAKQSLYNNFSSKDDLVCAYIEARHAEWLALYEARYKSAATPKDRVLAVFDAYADHAAAAYVHGFRGCGLLNAAAELSKRHPAREAVRQHKEAVEAIIREHVEDHRRTAPNHARPLARQLAFLLEGAIVRAGLEGSNASVMEARDMASSLLDAP